MLEVERAQYVDALSSESGRVATLAWVVWLATPPSCHLVAPMAADQRPGSVTSPVGWVDSRVGL